MTYAAKPVGRTFRRRIDPASMRAEEHTVSENLRNFTKAVYGIDAVIARVPDDAWDLDSPCEGWTARDVLGHHIGVLNGVTHMAAGNDMVFPAAPDDMSDPKGVWADCRDRLLATLDQPGALQHEGPYWFGPMSIDELIAIVQWDPLTHAWDLEQATGVAALLDERLAQQSFDRISPMREALAARGLVGEAVAVPDDADIVSRFLGLVGRDPHR
jgi:uncharacterized protein (TIGR03086 family)